jgi:type I restriction enzyme S subunit
MPRGAVLFSSRAPIGYCAIAQNDISTNQGFKSLVLPDQIVPEFIRYYLLASKEYAESIASGTTFRELSGSRMATLPVPIAPTAEQRRISAKLNSLFTRTKTARDELALIPLLVEHYKLSILEKAFSGKLTADYRTTSSEGNTTSPTTRPSVHGKELPRLPSGWRYLQLEKLLAGGGEAITTGPFGSLLGKKDYRPEGTPIVGVENVKPMGFIEGFSQSLLALQKQAN